jgi:2-aminobenzoate-CoA ligase
VRGPTGCRYLADQRQTSYVSDGWNLTGDAYIQDEKVASISLREPTI